ncbi:MAG: prealbumin-like fold domain-containing protein [Coriobacteriales bacterium]|nr:prealbumin-like fold domain-containing protein [Coriobacteriales bacterium]
MRKRLARILSMFMCLVLVMGNTPSLSTCVRDARAEESIAISNAQELSDSADLSAYTDSMPTKATSGQASPSDQADGQEFLSQSATPLDQLVVPTYSSGTLRTTHVFANGAYYHVSLEYDESAAIPEGAELQLSEPDARGLRSSFEQALKLQEKDRVLEDAYLKLQITADGQAIEPAAPVDIRIETNAFAPEQAASIEAALLSPSATAAEHILPRTLGRKDTDPKLSMRVEHLGTLALGAVVGSIKTWQQPDLDVTLLGPRFGLSVELSEVDAPQFEEGIETSACVQINASSSSAADAGLWVEATPRKNAARAQDELGGTFAYGMANGAVLRTLFDTQGTTGPLAFNASEEQLLIVWDSGYRKLDLNMSEVRVEGLAPEGTSGSASDVAANYTYPEGIIPAASGAAQTKPQEGLPAHPTVLYETIAAYDINLKTDGEEYQPDEEHPLTVTIANADIAPGKALQLWHIQDDGTTTQVQNVEFRQGEAVFEATGFSTYLLTASTANGTQTLSDNFTLRATASSWGRNAKVTFVDQNKNPLNSTVSGTYKISYTGVADTSNETNTIDLYDFADKLDPAIADEYEFSRVYIHLNSGAGDQKDFRYVQVGDGRNIATDGSTTLYRAYIHMNSIDENRAGQDYNGTWYQLSLGGVMDPMFIEYYHVAKASFYALDERDKPVQGAEFTLYSDPECYTPFEYKGEVVRATSNSSGLVSFGKIPRGNYYMKETVIPEGFKQTTKVYPLTVDGQTTLPDVIHADDDGSIIVSDVYEMTISDTGADHDYASVEVTVYCDDEVYTSFDLNADCNWTHKLTGLNPNKSYVISETAIRNSIGRDITQDWAPEITTSVDSTKDKTLYYRANAFQQGKEYALIINPGTSNSKALTALTNGSTLTPALLESNAEEITGTVSDYMLWSVVKVSADGVITLQNDGSDRYLNQADGKKWHQSEDAPLFVRHTNNNGVINIYYRINKNIATSYYLYMVNNVDRTTIASDAADFAIYKKLNLHSAEVSITNKATTYPMLIKNVVYPSGDALPGMGYKLYKADESDESKLGKLYYDNLVAASDGHLTNSGSTGSTILSLQAGSYFLVQQSRGDEGYEPLYAEPEQPLAFVVTRKGKIGIKGSYAIPSLEYSSTTTVGQVEYPLLRVPHYLPATVEVQLQVRGDYANLDKEFNFTIGFPRDTEKLVASIDGTSHTFTASNNSFTLKNGQTLRIENVHVNQELTITQVANEYRTQVEASDPSKATLTLTQSDAKAFTLSQLAGTTESPARITITNTLGNVEVPATGTDDNTNVWLAVALTGLAALVCLPFLRRIRT